jgi:hypothetical protein
MCALHPIPERPTVCTCAADETPEQGRAIRVARMRRLAELGMRLAETVVMEAEAGPPAGAAPDPAAPDPSLRFARVARVVHQITALEDRLANPPAPRAAGLSPARPEPSTPFDSPTDDDQTAETFDIVHALIAKGRTPRAADEATEEIYAEIEDRFDALDLVHRPLGELVAEVAQAFVLRPDWSPWAGEAWVPDAERRWDELMDDDATDDTCAQAP